MWQRLALPQHHSVIAWPGTLDHLSPETNRRCPRPSALQALSWSPCLPAEARVSQENTTFESCLKPTRPGCSCPAPCLCYSQASGLETMIQFPQLPLGPRAQGLHACPTSVFHTCPTWSHMVTAHNFLDDLKSHVPFSLILLSAPQPQPFQTLANWTPYREPF